MDITGIKGNYSLHFNMIHDFLDTVSYSSIQVQVFGSLLNMIVVVDKTNVMNNTTKKRNNHDKG